MIPTLATREDLAKLDGRLTSMRHKELTALSWRIVTWTTGITLIAISGAFFIARHVN